VQDSYTHNRPCLLNMDEIEAAILLPSFDPEAGLRWWEKEGGGAQQVQSFNALSFANKLYSQMDNATVSIEVIHKALYAASWATVETESTTITTITTATAIETDDPAGP